VPSKEWFPIVKVCCKTHLPLLYGIIILKKPTAAQEVMPLLGRRSNQATFFSEAVKERLPKNHFLKVNDLIDWSPIEKRLERLYDPSNGRPGYPPLVMFKALLLQQWFNLSDRGLAEAIADRLSFQSFLGLSIVDPVPDDTTFTRFRQKLQEKGMLEELFSILDSEFDRLGLLVKKGSFVDATIIQAQRRPPSKEKDDEDEKKERGSDSAQIHSSAEDKDHFSHDERTMVEAKDDALKLTKNGKAYYAADPDASGQDKARPSLLRLQDARQFR